MEQKRRIELATQSKMIKRDKLADHYTMSNCPISCCAVSSSSDDRTYKNDSALENPRMERETGDTIELFSSHYSFILLVLGTTRTCDSKDNDWEIEGFEGSETNS